MSESENRCPQCGEVLTTNPEAPDAPLSCPRCTLEQPVPKAQPETPGFTFWFDSPSSEPKAPAETAPPPLPEPAPEPAPVLNLEEPFVQQHPLPAEPAPTPPLFEELPAFLRGPEPAPTTEQKPLSTSFEELPAFLQVPIPAPVPEENKAEEIKPDELKPEEPKPEEVKKVEEVKSSPEVLLLDLPTTAPLPTARVHTGASTPEPLPINSLEIEDVPVVRSTARPSQIAAPAPKTDQEATEKLPEAKPIHPPVQRPPIATVKVPTRVESTYPRRRPEDVEEVRPQPKVGLAIFVLFMMFLFVVGGLSVIVYAVWAGFKSVPRPSRTEAPAYVQPIGAMATVAWKPTERAV